LDITAKNTSVLKSAANDSATLSFPRFLQLVFICCLGANALADEARPDEPLSWIVAERELTLASELSEPVLMALTGVGGPEVAKKTTEFPTTKAAWQAAADMRSASSTVTLDALREQFDVRIQVGEISGIRVHDISPLQRKDGPQDYVFIHLHGGGYLFGGGAMGAGEGAAIASATGLRVISIDYALLPNSPFPAALNDVVAVYRELLQQLGAANIAMGGSSAGGHLALSTCHKLKSLGLDLPKALFLGTPLADLTLSGDTVVTNAGIDNVIGTFDGFHAELQALFADGHDLTDPLLSPLFGDFDGFPATYLVSGTRDILLSDTVRVHLKLRRANVPADLVVFEGLPHGAYAAVPNSPEFNMAYDGLSIFLRRYLLML
jgi:acetyl esterase/lipase